MYWSVTNTYDRLGRQKTAQSSLASSTFAYDPDCLALVSETIIANGATNVITRGHDALGRNSGFVLGDNDTVTYGYDAYGRFNAVSSSVFSASFLVEYAHLANSDLVQSTTLSHDGVAMVSTKSYEDHRNLITAVEHEVDATLISRYTYANNQIGHRTSVINEGSAFADVGDAMNFYGYNTRGEVTNAVRRWGNNPGSPGDIVAGQTFGYDYDPIGNRTWSKRGGYSREYDANELNQYSSRGVPGVSHLLGSADESASVTVNGQSVTRQNAYWYKDLAITNDTDPQYPEVVIDATWFNILSSVTGNVFVAETPEDFDYDDDGNMVSDGRFAYTWDGENRLVAVETLTNVVAASGAPQVRVEYAYDHMSRRIGKTVYSDFTTNSAYATTNQTAYLYDGWNLISETILNQQSQITNLYVWGLDLSGSLQGAGGIGGLLSAVCGLQSAVSFYTADANGNVGQLLDAANPTNILAHYEYSPFGETLVAVGDLAKSNPFRFSTKYHEDESGLVYYGYRYYKPEIGRWVNRDPIGEWGGLNIYLFVDNYTVNRIDFLGLWFRELHGVVIDDGGKHRGGIIRSDGSGSIIVIEDGPFDIDIVGPRGGPLQGHIPSTVKFTTRALIDITDRKNWKLMSASTQLISKSRRVEVDLKTLYDWSKALKAGWYGIGKQIFDTINNVLIEEATGFSKGGLAVPAQLGVTPYASLVKTRLTHTGTEVNADGYSKENYTVNWTAEAGISLQFGLKAEHRGPSVGEHKLIDSLNSNVGSVSAEFLKESRTYDTKLNSGWDCP